VRALLPGLALIGIACASPSGPPAGSSHPTDSSDHGSRSAPPVTGASSASLDDEVLQARLVRAASEPGFGDLRRGRDVLAPLDLVPPAPSAPAASAAPRSPPPAAPPVVASSSASPGEVSRGPFPIVVLEGDDVRFEGRPAGSTRKIVDEARMRKVEELFSATVRWRTGWKEKFPGALFPGVVGLRVQRETPMVVVKSLTATMAFAGFPVTYLQLAGAPEPIIEIVAQIPRPPSPDESAPTPEPVLYLQRARGDVKLTWKLAGTVTRESSSPADGTLTKAVCDQWQQHAIHRDPKDERQDRVVLSVENALTAAELGQLADWVAACTRRYVDVRGAESERPAFWLQLSPR
jgi:hypothetical protein